MKKSALLLSACVLTACSGNPAPESGKPADTQATADTPLKRPNRRPRPLAPRPIPKKA